MDARAVANACPFTNFHSNRGGDAHSDNSAGSDFHTAC